MAIALPPVAKAEPARADDLHYSAEGCKILKTLCGKAIELIRGKKSRKPQRDSL